MNIRRSALADKYLTDLRGLEIGGGAHNAFGLNTLNVDYTDELTEYKKAEIEACGEALWVDIIANGDDLPFKDKTVDFVVSSHVIEHFFDPIKALKEWARVSRKYIYVICPHKERTFDREKPRTPLQELIDRHEGRIVNPDPDNHSHHSIWITEDFLELCNYLNLEVVEYLDVDDKVGNGFAVMIRL